MAGSISPTFRFSCRGTLIYKKPLKLFDGVSHKVSWPPDIISFKLRFFNSTLTKCLKSNLSEIKPWKSWPIRKCRPVSSFEPLDVHAECIAFLQTFLGMVSVDKS